MIVSCETVAKAFAGRGYGDVPYCCSSCHDDVEGRYGYMNGDDENFSVCCDIALYLKSLGVDIYPAPTRPVLLEYIRGVEEGA